MGDELDLQLRELVYAVQQHPVKSGEWMQGVFTEGWQSIEEVFSQRELSFRFARSFSIIRCKKLDIGLHLNGTSVALIVKLNSLEEDKFGNSKEIKIVLQVHPSPDTSVCLPPALKLVVFDDKGVEVDSVISRQNDNWVEIELTAELNERFQVEIILGESKVTQEFTV